MCQNRGDSYRARTLFIKETGTVDWIERHFMPGEHFIDIGANIGVYSLLAAKKLGNNGCVYAFEPHSANINSLIQNIKLNALGEQIKVFGIALGRSDGFFEFEYIGHESSSSGSQLMINLGGKTDEANNGTELKYTSTVDRLIEIQSISNPQHVKIDVDGIELEILLGMKNLLNNPSSKPKTIQVEVSKANCDLVRTYLEGYNYNVIATHHTIVGEKLRLRIDSPSIIQRLIALLRRKIRWLRYKVSLEELLEAQPYNVIFGINSDY
jgi:FkbM family methyltransferase